MLHAFGNTRMKFIAGAILLAAASAANAQSVTLVAGGATLPAFGYGGDTTTRLIQPIDGSFLKTYADANGVATTYCQTGSGGGKNILAGGVAGFNVNAACDATASPTGFGGTGLAQANFIGSDSPYSSTDYSTYRTGHSNVGQPVQVPSVAGAVAIVFNKPEIESLTLTEAQVCGIFSGQITDWSQLDSSTSGQIKVAYRSDGSGTSFAFTNHLSAKCGAAAGGNGVATAFKTDQSFATAASTYIGQYAASLPASGNPGVVSAVVANEGSIGYAEAANSLVGGSQTALLVNDATGQAEDPTAFGATDLPVTVTFDKVIGPVDGNGRPTLVTLSAAQANCIALVDPATYALPTSGYPIVAVSYLIANSNNNGSTTTAIRNLLQAPYNATIKANTFTIGANAGGVGLGFLSATGLNAADVASRCVASN